MSTDGSIGSGPTGSERWQRRAREFVAKPSLDEVVGARVFSHGRRVGLGDVDPMGRVRLDALARYLQDVATADYQQSLVGTSGAQLLPSGAPGTKPDVEVFGFVLRRSAVFLATPEIGWPTLGQHLTLDTFAGGLGNRWAERRTEVRSEAGGVVECASLWVAIDGSGRPRRLSEHFRATYAASARGREVGARLRHPEPPLTESSPQSGDAELHRRWWPIRHADIDTLGHVNNAAQWQGVEELIAETVASAQPRRGGVVPTIRYAEVEFRSAISPRANVELVWRSTRDNTESTSSGSSASSDSIPGVHGWLLEQGVLQTTCVVEFDSEPAV